VVNDRSQLYSGLGFVVCASAQHGLSLDAPVAQTDGRGIHHPIILLLYDLENEG